MMLDMLENGYKTPFWSPQLLAAEVGKGFFVCGLQNFIKPYHFTIVVHHLKTPFWSLQLLAAEVGKGFFICGLQNFIKPYHFKIVVQHLKHFTIP